MEDEVELQKEIVFEATAFDFNNSISNIMIFFDGKSLGEWVEGNRNNFRRLEITTQLL